MTPSIEVDFPDIRCWASGNTGLPYVWSFSGAAPGPHLCITALVHGNEVCGAIALDRLLPMFVSDALQPRRGRVSFVFANVEAYLVFDPARPLASRSLDEDFNRLWDAATVDGPRQSRELTRARALRPFFDTVDHLLDLHSMTLPAPPIALAGTTAKGLALARALGMPRDILVDAGHAAGRRLRDYADFADPESARSAVLIECGQHWEAAVGEIATECAWRFLEHFGALTRPASALRLEPPQARERVIDITEVVTVAPGGFSWTRPLSGLETIPRAGTVIATNGGAPVATPHDEAILVMPTQDPKPGTTAVRIGRVRS
jgi:predicted deacylase